VCSLTPEWVALCLVRSPAGEKFNTGAVPRQRTAIFRRRQRAGHRFVNRRPYPCTRTTWGRGRTAPRGVQPTFQRQKWTNEPAVSWPSTWLSWARAHLGAAQIPRTPRATYLERSKPQVRCLNVDVDLRRRGEPWQRAWRPFAARSRLSATRTRRALVWPVSKRCASPGAGDEPLPHWGQVKAGGRGLAGVFERR
jgi:hypothetical protein